MLTQCGPSCVAGWTSTSQTWIRGTEGTHSENVRHLLEGQQLLFVLAEQHLDRHVLDASPQTLIDLHLAGTS